MKTLWAGAISAISGVLVYFGIAAWIFLGGHEHEPLTGEQGTLWTLAVTVPLFFGTRDSVRWWEAMSRCVCTHIRALHFDGVCRASISPCGCTSYEPPEQADRPSRYSRTTRDEYNGTYTRRYKA